MLTLLLTPRRTEDTERMAQAAQGRGLSVVQPATWSIPALPSEKVLIYGGELFLQLACQELKLPLPVIDPGWLPTLPPALLQRRLIATQLSWARRLSGPIFVKPIQNKCFAAGVYASGAALPELPDEEPVYISEPVHFVREYRCFLKMGVCKTGSLYAVEGCPPLEPVSDKGFPAAAQLAEQAWRAVPTLPEGVVIDVGLLGDGRWAVVEANPLAESALYGADAGRVLEMLALVFRYELPSTGFD